MADPISVWERLGSRVTRADDNGTEVETLWDIIGTNNELEVRYNLGQTCPTVYHDSVGQRLLRRRSHSVTQIGDLVWEGTVTFSVPDPVTGTGGNDPNGGFDPNGDDAGGPPGGSPAPSQCYQGAFDTTAQQTKITHSIRTVQGYGHFDTLGNTFGPPDYKGAIGVKIDSDGKVEIEGVDAYFPSLKWDETHEFPASQVTEAYIKTLGNLTASVCATGFRSYDVGETLFLGAQGQTQTDGKVPIKFHFEASANRTGLTVAGISGIDKRGWDYLWVSYEDKIDTSVTPNRKSTQSIGVYVEQIYPYLNWGGLALPC